MPFTNEVSVDCVVFRTIAYKTRTEIMSKHRRRQISDQIHWSVLEE
jgi:hypothetical protein